MAEDNTVLDEALESTEPSTEPSTPSQDDWYQHTPTSTAVAKHNNQKPLYIVLGCIAMAFLVALGWVFGAIFGTLSEEIKQDQTVSNQAILQFRETIEAEIVKAQFNSATEHVNAQIAEGSISSADKKASMLFYLKSNYFQEVDDNQWNSATKAVATGSTLTVEHLQKIVNYLRTHYDVDLFNTKWNDALSYTDEMHDRGQVEQEAILSTVLDYLYEKYYKTIDQTAWDNAIAQAGSALLAYAGDQYSFLMTPQEYYDFNHPQSSGGVSYDPELGLFGVTYSVSEGLGMVVSGVMADSSCYGRLQEGDIIVKLSNVLDKYGHHPSVNVNGQLTTIDTLVTGHYTTASIQQFLALVKSATFHVLRDGEILQIDIVRGDLGMTDNPYSFVEYYFDDLNTNISTSVMHNAAVSTKQLRSLENLPSDVGYVRIVEFMYYLDGNKQITAFTEFKEVMQKFEKLGKKRLILDLKGNPGGLVSAVCDVASLLVTDAKLSETDKTKVNQNGSLLITSLTNRDGKTSNYRRLSYYNQYFDTPTEVCDIVVWTDGNSASASELLTGALTDYKTAVHMGTRTYGKGIAQTVDEIPFFGTVTTIYGTTQQGCWAVYYTHAAYYAPLGKNIHGVGYVPSNAYNNLYEYQDLMASTLQYWNY